MSGHSSRSSGWKSKNGKERTRFSFPTEPIEILRVEGAQPFKNLTILPGRTAAASENRTPIQKLGTSLKTEFASIQSITTARTAIDRLTGLFSLLVGESVYPKKIRLMLLTNSKLHPVDLFLSLRRRRVRLEHAHQMTFALSDILKDAPSLIRQWLTQEEKLRPVYNLLLSTVQAPDQYVQSTFLSLTQALESFHRIVYGGKYASEDDYNNVKDALERAIPADTSDHLKKKLMTMLHYGNQFSQRERLRGLFDVLGIALTEKLLGTEKQSHFISKVVDIRNHLTHHDQASESIAALG